MRRTRAAPRKEAGLAALLVLSMVIWGGTWPSGKIVAPLASFEATVFLRFLVTSLSLLAVCLWRRESLLLPRSSLAWALVGAALMSAYNYFFLGGLSWGLAAKGGVIVTCLNPILTFAISAAAFRRRVGPLEAVGLALGLGAGALLLGVWKLDSGELFRSGNVFFLGAALAWSSLTVVSQAGQRKAGYLAFSLWVYLLSTALNAGVVAVRGFHLGVSSPALFWANLLYLGVLGTAFATTVYFLAARRLGAHRAGSFIFLVPGFAILLGWLLLGEVPEWTTLAGLAVAIAAVALVNRGSGQAGRTRAKPRDLDARAAQINEVLDRGVAGSLLSELGRRLFMPRGIVVQAGEARRLATRFDGSAGIALERAAPLHLSAVHGHFRGLEPAELYSYSPTQGNPALRKRWAELLLEKNPSLEGACLSLPVVVPGLTFGVSAAADLFLDPGDTVLVPEPFWDNYDLVFRVRRGARIARWPLFDAGDRFSVAGLRTALREAIRSGRSRAVVLFNFPHNPSGYTPTPEEAGELTGAIVEAARGGLGILAVLDDAYFGLGYEQGVSRESLFAGLVRAHEKVLALKVDGTTKEDMAWGFRVAFMTFGGAALDRACCDALEEKLAGELRSVVSSSSTPAQTLLLRALEGGDYRRDKDAAFRLLEARYRVVRRVVDRLSREQPGLAHALPFNSGYFVCLRLEGGRADGVRRRLLEREGIGTVALGEDLLRIAYSAVDSDGLEPLLEAVYRVIGELHRGGRS